MHHLNRPQTFLTGDYYLYREHTWNRSQNDPSMVIFSSYTASPMFVVVQNRSGSKIRCPRDDLFECINSGIPLPLPSNPHFAARIIKIPLRIIKKVVCDFFSRFVDGMQYIIDPAR